MAKKKPTLPPGISDGEILRRKSMTFQQAEGLVELPRQMRVGEINHELRTNFWNVIYPLLDNDSHWDEELRTMVLFDPWAQIFYDKYMEFDHRLIDDFKVGASTHMGELKGTLLTAPFGKVFDTLQWILRHKDCPREFAKAISTALTRSKSAYVLVDNDTFVPLSSEQERSAISAALSATKELGFEGPHAHLKSAAKALTSGNWADSIRESIHAVEAAAKIIAPEAKNDALRGALTAVAKKHNVHEAMQKGFASLYGFTSDEKGIRHALLHKGDANVDATDAQYMLGACAAFVSYLLARARQ